MRIRIYSYNQGSRSAKALSEALGGKVLKRVGSKYKQRPDDLIINWGAGDCPFKGRRVANQPEAIALAANKLTAFKKMEEHNVNMPAFYTKREDIPNDAYPVMARTVLTGHSGRGIVVCNGPDNLVPAPLYVKYVKKQDEYRIHVLRKPGEATSIISIQRKAKRRDVAQADFMIRNLANGFVFVRDGVAPPEDVLEQSKKAVEALGLAFGAVDVIWNERQRKAYVLEVNTAPGLEGQTVEDYANAFRNIG
jgi:glutathione synthase/RimK-type ligase-like ATP-grasp enzyme